MRTKGFTLVELLTTIAIIAILATVSVVGYFAFFDRAYNSVARAELKQIQNSIHAAMQENGVWEFTSADGKKTVRVTEKDGIYTVIGASDLADAIKLYADFNSFGQCVLKDTDLVYTASAGKGTAVWKNVRTSPNWRILTDHTTLSAGSKIVIVTKNHDLAFSVNANGTISATPITRNGDIIYIEDDTMVITLEDGDFSNSFEFNLGNLKGDETSEYLYKSYSANVIKVKSGSGSSFKVIIDNDGKTFIDLQSSFAASGGHMCSIIYNEEKDEFDISSQHISISNIEVYVYR